MSILDTLFLTISSNNIDGYRSILNGKEITLSSSNETSILISCIENNNKLFFDEFIDFKKDNIYYFHFKDVISKIIELNKIEFMKIILNIKNIHFYYSFEKILQLSIELNEYNIINTILKENLFNFEKNYFTYNVYNLIEIKNFDCIQMIIENFNNRLQFNPNDDFYVEYLYVCEDSIFELLLNFILTKDLNYLEKESIQVYNKNKFTENKFELIYNKKSDKWKEQYLEISIYQAFIQNNKNLFSYLYDKYIKDENKMIQILKKRNNVNNRTIINTIFSYNTVDTSYILYNKIKEKIVLNYNQLILKCIETNNHIMLSNLNYEEIKQHINIKKITNYIINSYNDKYMSDETLNIILYNFHLISNKSFIHDYSKKLINNNDKILLTKLITNIEKYNDDKINKSLKKLIYNHLKNFLIQNRFIEGDTYDWYFIEWLNTKFSNLKIMELSEEIIKENIKNYEPNIHFIYWYLGQNNIHLEKEEITELLIRLHSHSDKLTNIMIENIEKDYILVKKIKDILTSEDLIKKTNLLNSIFYSKNKKDQVLKIENYDDEMKDIFKNHVYNNIKFFNTILKELILSKNNDLIIYIFDKMKNLKISSYKIIFDCINCNKNYYLLDRISKALIKKDNQKFYGKILIDSIKNYDFIIFEWSYNKLKELSLLNEIIDENISKTLQNLVIYNQYVDIYNFLVKIYDYVNEKNKDIIHYIILHSFGDNKLLVEHLLVKVIKYDKLVNSSKFKLLFNMIYNLNKYDIIPCIDLIKFTKEDYIDFNKYIENYDNTMTNINLDILKYNLLYQHKYELIEILSNKGLELKFNNNILYDLFNCSYFNKKTNDKLNNYNIFKLVKKLSENGYFKIDTETLIIFLDNYHKIKYKIKLNDVKYIIENNDIDISYDVLFHTASSKTKDIFDYLLSLKDINLKENNEELLLSVFLKNDVEFAKYLLEIEPSFDISINNDNIFSQCCNEGVLDSIKWLYQNIENMNEKTKYEYSICGACYYGHIEVAQWLIENIEGLDIKVDNDYCMVNAVEYEYFDLVDWILEIEPNRYNVVYNETLDEILSFEINKKLVIEKSKEIEIKKECPICYDNMSKIITCCDHQFCYDCFNEYYKKNTNISCPYCRKENIELFNIV